MKAPDTSHCFAVYVPALQALELTPLGTVTDLAILHRIMHVLRLSSGERCIFFDDQYHMVVRILESARKHMVVECLTKELHTPLKPWIEWVLPILKREAFEEALYTLTEMGATAIHPIYTAKTSRVWVSDKEYARARAIMIAAAEQSKQYIIPHIFQPVPLTAWSSQQSSARICFDVNGMSLSKLFLQVEQPPSLIGCVGPEGDFTSDEREYLRGQGFLFCALTPTVLRAQQALAVGLGLLRSYYR